MKISFLQVLCILFGSSIVFAAPINYDLSGTIISINDTSNALSGYGLTESTSTFVGSFTYDPEIAFYSGDTTTAANYRNLSAFELNITIDNQWEFLETDPIVSVQNDSAPGGGDRVSFQFHTAYDTPEAFAFPTGYRYFFNIQFQDLSGTALSDTSLPDSINLDDFGFSHMYIGEYDYPYTLTGSFNSVSLDSGLDNGPAPVPEPSTFFLLSGGLAGLAFVARRRRKE